MSYLWQEYVDWKAGTLGSGIPTSGISQHNQLATNYVTVIAAALEEFQPGLPQQYYNDLAWGGLAGTIPYNNLPYADRIRISKVQEAEATNQIQNDPMGQPTYHPQGVPCNN